MEKNKKQKRLSFSSRSLIQAGMHASKRRSHRVCSLSRTGERKEERKRKRNSTSSSFFLLPSSSSVLLRRRGSSRSRCRRLRLIKRLQHRGVHGDGPARRSSCGSSSSVGGEVPSCCAAGPVAPSGRAAAAAATGGPRGTRLRARCSSVAANCSRKGSSSSSSPVLPRDDINQEIEHVGPGDGRGDVIPLQRPPLVLLGMPPGAERELEHEGLAGAGEEDRGLGGDHPDVLVGLHDLLREAKEREREASE